MNSTFHALLPKKILSATMYRLSRIRQPIIKNIAIKVFMTATGANLEDAARKNIDEYDSLLDFFTRELADGVRPLAAEEKSIVCPVDGRVAHVGDVIKGQIFQIKGYTYSLSQLVGQDYAENYRNGQAATIYLAPFDYHRIHMPMDGKLERARYIPGELNSVSITLLDKIAGLFAKNERVVLEFSSDSSEKFLMVLVGAVNVGSIETIFHGEISPNKFDEVVELAASDKTLKKGEELGRFNLGSTIVYITASKNQSWNVCDNEKTKLGQLMANETVSNVAKLGIDND